MIKNNRTIEGIYGIPKSFLKVTDYDSFLISLASGEPYIAYTAGLGYSRQNPYESIYIDSPVILGTLRKGISFIYKNLEIKIQEASKDGEPIKMVSVSLEYATVHTHNPTYYEYYQQVTELTSCFKAHNSKLVNWKITTPLTDKVNTDLYLDLSIGKHKLRKLMNLPIQGANYVRYTVNDTMLCSVSSPTRTVEVLDLRNNEDRTNTLLLIESNVVEILVNFGVILLSTKNEDIIQSMIHFFKTDKVCYFLGTYANMTDFNIQSNARRASYALMNKNKNIVFVANILAKDN